MMVVHAKIHTKLYIASCCGRRQMHRFVLLRSFKKYTSSLVNATFGSGKNKLTEYTVTRTTDTQ